MSKKPAKPVKKAVQPGRSAPKKAKPAKRAKPANQAAPGKPRAVSPSRSKPRTPSASAPFGESQHLVIRPGGPVVIFTIGYQGRDGDEVIELLLKAGVEHLADIRAKPLSRNPEFRGGPLRRRCEAAGIEYGAWQSLGTPDPIRARVKATRDYGTFHRVFRAYAVEEMGEPLEALAALAAGKRTALLCLERAHDECHRADIADLLADRLGAGITAIT